VDAIRGYVEALGGTVDVVARVGDWTSGRMSVELKCVVIACIVGVLSSSALMTSLVAQCLTRCGSMPRATRRSRGHRRCSTACSGRASGSSPGPSSSAGSPNAARFGARPVSVIGRDQPPVAGGHDQLRHRRAEATALAGLADVGARCQQGLAIQQHRAAGGSCATSGGPVRGAWRLGHRECPSREVSSLILTRQAGKFIEPRSRDHRTSRGRCPLGAIWPGI
jgi:hypothetical protein